MTDVLEAHYFVSEEEEKAYKKFMADDYFSLIKLGYKEVDDLDERDELLAKYR